MSDPIVVYVAGTPRPYEGTRFAKGHAYRGSKSGVRALYRKQLMAECRLQGGPIRGPVQLKLDLWFETKDLTRVGKPHTSKVDTDNIIKVWKDCAEAAGILPDGDQYVARDITTKLWSLKAGALATFEPFAPAEED